MSGFPLTYNQSNYKNRSLSSDIQLQSKLNAMTKFKNRNCLILLSKKKKQVFPKKRKIKNGKNFSHK